MSRYAVLIALLAISIVFGVAGTVLGIIALVRTSSSSDSGSAEVKKYSLPPQSIQIDRSTYSISYPEHHVQGIAMIHWHHNSTSDDRTVEKRMPATPSEPKKVVHSQCLGNINPGTRWRTVEDYIVDTDNNQGLSSSFISSAAATAASTWNRYLSFKPFGRQRIGDLAGGTSFTGSNGLAFGAIDISGAEHAIAVTVVYWSCTRVCSYIEWKQIYNTVNYRFGSGAICGSSIIDLTNTMMHEFGHSIGEIDLTDSACSEDTMFHTEGFCETKKITLEDDDIYDAQHVIGYGDSGAAHTGEASHPRPSAILAIAYAVLVIMMFY